jgi:hypothetical protein
VTGRIKDLRGDPIPNSVFRIDDEIFDRRTEEDGKFIITLGEGEHDLFFFYEGTLNRTLSLNISYGQDDVFLDTIYLGPEPGADSEPDEPPPYILLILGTALIIITIFFAVSAFRREGGPLDEE